MCVVWYRELQMCLKATGPNLTVHTDRQDDSKTITRASWLKESTPPQKDNWSEAFPQGLSKDLLKMSPIALLSKQGDWLTVLNIKFRQKMGKDWTN